MEGLRLILLALGAIVIAGVYLYSRRGGGTDRNVTTTDVNTARRRQEPHLRVDVDDEFPEELPSMHAMDVSETGNAREEPKGPDQEEPPPANTARDETIIVLNILPVTDGEVFPGADLLDVFDRAGLEYGQYDVFHRVRETDEGPRSVFSVASATEPGSFDITTMADESFRGLTMFMVLPGPMRGVDGFADMLATARRIAEQIRGDVKDRNRSTLTRQTAHHIREEIIAFEHRVRIES